jgi:hypothetical protein
MKKKIITIDIGDWSFYEVDNFLDSMKHKKPYVPMTKWQTFKKYQVWDIFEFLGYALVIGSIWVMVVFSL